MPDQPSAKRLRAARRRMLTSVLLVLVVIGLAAGSLSSNGPSPFSMGAAGGADETFASQPGYGVLEEAWAVVRDQYVAIADVPPEDLIRGAGTGMVEGLGDLGHSRFLDPADAERFRRAIDGTPVGIGVSLRSINDFLVVRDVIPNGPAEAAGVERGDVILTLNGDDVSGLSPSDLDPWFDRVPGTTVVLGLYRPVSDTEREIRVVQRELDVDTVSWALLPGDIAQIRIASFDRDTAPDLADAIVSSRTAGATSIIIDLRDNPGGLVDELVNAVSLFLPADMPVFQTVDAAGTVNRWLTVAGAIARDTPLVVLVNRHSASAAEIMATALDYYGRAEVVGQTTFGTGTILYSADLSDGSAVVIGRQLWQTPGGETVWLTGYQPDEEVALGYGEFPFIPADGQRLDSGTLAGTGDDQLLAAIADLGVGQTAPSVPPGTPPAAISAVTGPGVAATSAPAGTGALALDPDSLDNLR